MPSPASLFREGFILAAIVTLSIFIFTQCDSNDDEQIDSTTRKKTKNESMKKPSEEEDEKNDDLFVDSLDIFCRQIEPDDPNALHSKFESDRMTHEIMIARSHRYAEFLNSRRSTRFFSPDPVPIEIIQNCIRTAGTSPSGAHRQPWHFVIVQSHDIKRQIKELVEREERLNYERRMKRQWVDDLEDMMSALHAEGIDKPYLEIAPYLIVAMKKNHSYDDDGNRLEHYYVQQSVGIACGLLISALHHAGLFTLTSTPMGAEKDIREICGRPPEEKVFLLLPVGYCADNCTVPYRVGGKLRMPMDKLMSVV